jgi:cardiolipin synthase
MAIATGGCVVAASGALARHVRLTLSVVAANAANLLTIARLCCAVPIVLLVRAGEYHQAALIFILAALSDGLDGYIAKRFNAVTSLGTVLDPVADKLLMDSLFLTLAFEGHLPAWIALLVIARDLLIVTGTLALRYMAGRFRVEPLFLGKLATLMQIFLGGAVLLQLSYLPALGQWLHPLQILTAMTLVASAAAYVQAAGRIWVLARVPR